jgi:hypothetical protein
MHLFFVKDDAPWLGRTYSWCAPGNRPTNATPEDKMALLGLFHLSPEKSLPETDASAET